LRVRLRELAEERRLLGSPRLHILLRREGWTVNHKRVERIYREENDGRTTTPPGRTAPLADSAPKSTEEPGVGKTNRARVRTIG
jgi:transposase InsO family protein